MQIVLINHNRRYDVEHLARIFSEQVQVRTAESLCGGSADGAADMTADMAVDTAAANPNAAGSDPGSPGPAICDPMAAGQQVTWGETPSMDARQPSETLAYIRHLDSQENMAHESRLYVAVEPEANGVIAAFFPPASIVPIFCFIPAEGEQAVKMAVKQATYRVLCQGYHKTVPWGILVGVRPVKLVHQMLDQGMTEAAILGSLMGDYALYPEKAAMLVEIAGIERPFTHPGRPVPLSQNAVPGSKSAPATSATTATATTPVTSSIPAAPDPPATSIIPATDPTRPLREVDLYVGIPFCISRCYYCAFPGFLKDKHSHEMTPYLQALTTELVAMAPVLKRCGYTVRSLYIGGGTPTALEPEQLAALIETLYRNYDLTELREFTIEAGRPDTLTPEMLQVLQASGAHRFCLNPQTMQNKTLARIGRAHSVADICRVFGQFRSQMPTAALNMDLIAGLEGETVADFQDSLRQVVALRPENITVHTLSIKRASALNQEKERQLEALAGEAAVEQMVEWSQRYLREQGYGPYYLYRQKNILANLENVGYTLPGHACFYNMRIMEEQNTLLGFGLGASSKIIFSNDRFERHNNFKSFRDYAQRMDQLLAEKTQFLEESCKKC